jgi:hypothetical protein
VEAGESKESMKKRPDIGWQREIPESYMAAWYFFFFFLFSVFCLFLFWDRYPHCYVDPVDLSSHMASHLCLHNLVMLARCNQLDSYHNHDPWNCHHFEALDSQYRLKIIRTTASPATILVTIKTFRSSLQSPILNEF